MSQTIIIRPVVTEKAMQTDTGKFTFIVSKSASKTDIRDAILKDFNVHAVAISTSLIKGKRKRVGERRLEVKESATKKATVLLKKGEKLSLFTSGSDEGEKKKKKK